MPTTRFTRTSHALNSVLAATALAFAPFLAHADTLYTQPFAETANGGYFASTPGGFLQYDSFSLASNASIESLSWWGVDLNELIAGATELNPASFTVGIYADNGANSPGALLSFTTLGQSAGATSVGSLLGLVLYQYGGTLATPFQATAGTRYWIGISDPTDNADWYWASGAGPNGTHVGVVGGSPSIYADDLSFTLQGTVAAVPEPTSAALMLLGGLGLAGLRGARRRNRGTAL